MLSCGRRIVGLGRVPYGDLDVLAGSCKAPEVPLDLATVRLHAPDGDDLGTAELPDGWILESGDLLMAADGRLVRVDGIAPVLPGSAIAALVRVVPLAGEAEARR